MAFWQQESMSNHTTELVFLLDRNKQSRVSWAITEGQRLLLDGPYRHDLGLETYDIVILTAEGSGISAVLPLMASLAARRVYDKSGSLDKTLFRDQTRRVDLFWWLDDNSQAEWVADQLSHLKSLDSENACTGPLLHGDIRID